MKKLYLYEIEQKAQRFLNCQNLNDLYNLGFDTARIQLLSLAPPYYQFELTKKNGKKRLIEAPEQQLKDIQKQFNSYLQCIYFTMQTSASYGYIIAPRDKVHDKNILGNAKKHLGNKYMLNLDFEDFFHQITFDRILNLLQSSPFNFEKKTAFILTKIFTLHGRLPMGAPTSPAFSNLFTIELDNQLTEWSQKYRIIYTRFVDDLSFSTAQQAFSNIELGAIIDICTNNGFRINPMKTRFFKEDDIKKVTGLVLNETVDIDQEFYQDLDKDIRRLRYLTEVSIILQQHKHDAILLDFRKEVEGQINFIGIIEGYDSPEFYNYRKKMQSALEPDEEVLAVRWTNSHYF